MDPREAVAHLTEEHWGVANRLLVRKALAEFSHERLLAPVPQGDDRYVLVSDDRAVEYSFTASVLSLDHWQIDQDSITRSASGSPLPLDVLDFVVEFRETLNLGDELLPVYLEELSSTLAGRAYHLATKPPTAEELAAADFQAIESSMSEGHPCFVANNARLGFDIAEYHSYAPETGAPVRLIWLATRHTKTTVTLSAELTYEELVTSELDADTRRRFDRTLTDLGLDPDEYRLVPVHPWQWWNKLAVTYAADIARRHIVCLGHGDDEHRAQQSVRTFFNASDPTRHYVKTALSVLNMGFMRGLSAAYMQATPAINDWVGSLVHNDPLLRTAGFDVLKEVAAVGYHSEHYEAAAKPGSPYLKMFAGLWRESPVPKLRPGEHLATMAALLHTDETGRSVAGAFIADSGLSPHEWVRRYLDAYLTPLVHCFYAYGLVFIPHGENVILVLDERNVPLRVFVKDIAEEIGVCDPDIPLPPEAERVRVEMADELRTLSIFTDVVDCFLRFLNATLSSDDTLPLDDLWHIAADCIRDYQRSMPQLADRFAKYDLFAEEFPLCCLNRLQLRDNQQMLDLQDPVNSLELVGTLRNPLSGHG
ncbi:MAG: IucA/IucC family siderophore biosynthesis protein [Streptosporangiales bacterium]|nr:IucA/IucC family siderophore biosynthesis protein [Streptosporangiales bacterium]